MKVTIKNNELKLLEILKFNIDIILFILSQNDNVCVIM